VNIDFSNFAENFQGMLLFFNDVSGSEVLVILIFILMFFGSKSIPGIARTFGRTIRQIKDASSELQDEIRKSGVDVKKDLNLTGLIKESTTELAQPLDQMASDLDQSVRFEPIKKQVDPEVNILENQTTPSENEPNATADSVIPEELIPSKEENTEKSA
jgi:sec-independent protein translocase protein TatA